MRRESIEDDENAQEIRASFADFRFADSDRRYSCGSMDVDKKF
jgi:hypothetical protein